ncbi:hypothetical protein QFZ54_001490 [Sphingomonas faeni]|nr:hypothetical protein [Sphingomonas faeni]
MSVPVPALERDAIGGLADEIDGDEVTHLGRVIVGRVVPLLLLVGELLELLGNGLVGDGNGQALELDAVDRGSWDLRQDFHIDLDHGVLADVIAVFQRDRRLHRRAKLLLGDERLNALLDRGVHRVLGQCRTMHLADEVRRHLARTEARHLHLRREALQFDIDLGIDILRGDGERVGALEALVQRLDSLHVRPLL